MSKNSLQPLYQMTSIVSIVFLGYSQLRSLIYSSLLIPEKEVHVENDAEKNDVATLIVDCHKNYLLYF